jgi:hypothetical protein
MTGTVGPKSCVLAASATAWAILSTARSSSSRAACSGVRFIRRASGAKAASAAAREPRE